MSELFLKIVNMSISATWLVLIVAVLRFLLKKAPKWINVLLWGLVAVRLICPFTLESALSLIPSAETISPEIMMDATPEIHTGIEAVNSVVNPIITETFAPEPIASANPLQILIPVMALVWCIGMGLMLLYTLVTYWHLRHRVRMAVRVKENIYLCEYVSSPFVLGIFRPRIYLPYHMDEGDRFHVIAHERTHIQRKDHWWKPLGFLLLTIHWFNPVMWLAYILLCRDIELACDEKVVKTMQPEQRANYSQALLNCSIGRRTIAACPLAFGEVGVKERVKNVLRYKKPAFWVILVAVIVCIVVAVCFLTNPETPVELENLTGKTYAVTEMVYDDPRYSFTYVPGYNAPSYAISEEGHLLSQNELNSLEGWKDLGQLQTIELTEDSFDPYFYDIDFFRDGMSPASLRRDNVHAWQLVSADSYGDVLYYVLRQENGDVYLACGYSEPDPKLIRWVMKLEVQPEALWDLTMTAESISPTGLTLVFHQAAPVSDKFRTGADFVLDSFTGDGWITHPLPADTVWTTESYMLTNGTRMNVNWEYLYGELSPGTYRITKAVTDDKSSDGESRVMYAEFTITGNDIGPKTLEELTGNYSLEQAEIDGCLIMVDGDVRYNQQAWFDFVDGGNFIRFVTYYSGSESEPSSMYVHDLTYDGDTYTLRTIQEGQEYVKTYKHLRSFTGSAENPNVSYDAYERYVLTDNTSATYEEMWQSLLSSQSGVAIDFYEVYSDLIWFPDHPQIPDRLTEAALVITEGRDLVIDDANTLEALRTLLANAEFLGYYPKTPDFGPELRLTDPSGAVTTLYLGMDSDLFELDGNCFDYGPGYDGYGSNNDIDLLWQLLGLTEWTAPNVTKWPIEICSQYESYRETLEWAKENPLKNRMFIPISPDWETDTFTITHSDGTKAEITDAEREHIWEALSYAPLDKYYGSAPDTSGAEYVIDFTYKAWNMSCKVYALGNDQFYFTRTIDAKTYTCTSPALAQAMEEAMK